MCDYPVNEPGLLSASLGLSSRTPASHSNVSMFWMKYLFRKFFFAVSDVRACMTVGVNWPGCRDFVRV